MAVDWGAFFGAGVPAALQGGIETYTGMKALEREREQQQWERDFAVQSREDSKNLMTLMALSVNPNITPEQLSIAVNNTLGVGSDAPPQPMSPTTAYMSELHSPVLQNMPQENIQEGAVYKQFPTVGNINTSGWVGRGKNPWRDQRSFERYAQSRADRYRE